MKILTLIFALLSCVTLGNAQGTINFYGNIGVSSEYNTTTKSWSEPEVVDKIVPLRVDLIHYKKANVLDQFVISKKGQPEGVFDIISVSETPDRKFCYGKLVKKGDKAVTPEEYEDIVLIMYKDSDGDFKLDVIGLMENNDLYGFFPEFICTDYDEWIDKDGNPISDPFEERESRPTKPATPSRIAYKQI